MAGRLLSRGLFMYGFSLRGLAAVAALFVVGACSDDAPKSKATVVADMGPGPITPGTQAPDMGTDTPPPPVGSTTLELVGPRERLVGYNTRTEISVRYLEEGAPRANDTVSAKMYDDSGNDVTAGGLVGTALVASSARSAADGTAVFQIAAGNADTHFRIYFKAPGIEDAARPSVDITVSAASSGDLVVKAIYIPSGQPMGGRYSFRDIGKARVAIFNTDNCDMLRGMAADLRGAYLQLPDIMPFDSFSNESRANELDAGATFSVAVQALNREDNVLAFGCASGVTITGGAPTTVDVPVTDLPLQYKGRFDVVNKFDLTDMLSNSGVSELETVDQVLEIIGIIGNADGDRGNAIIALFCDVANLDEGICTIVQTVGGRAIDGLIEEFVPAEVLNILNIVGDIYNIVSELTVVGQIEFTAGTPDMNGDLPVTDNRWNRFQFNWRSGCPEPDPADCVRSFAIGPEANSRPINGQFTAKLVGVQLQIPEHSFTVEYGTILLAVTQDWIIPAILGEPGPVDLEEVLGRLLPCDVINESIGGSMFCESVLVAALSDLITDQISRLDVNVNQFTLQGTCDPKDTDGDLNIDLLDNGVWTGTIAFTDDARIPFRGCFKGCREVIDVECQEELTECEIPAAP
jgi:hypothetical protein